MGIIIMGCIGCGFDFFAEAHKIAQMLFCNMVTVHGNIDCHGMYSVYDDVVVLISESELGKMTFLCGIVVGANLLNIINHIKHRIRKKEKR